MLEKSVEKKVREEEKDREREGGEREARSVR